MEALVRELRERKAEAAGTEKDAAVQHAKGRATARERIEMLFDGDTFSEIDSLVTPRYDHYIGGKDSRPGRRRHHGIWADPRPQRLCGGAGRKRHGRLARRDARHKIVKAMQMALKSGCPLVALNDSGGARIQEGVDSLGGYARIFDANCEASGVIPQLSVIMGPCAGGAVYSPGLTDFVFMTENGLHVHHGPRRGEGRHAGRGLLRGARRRADPQRGERRLPLPGP